MRFPLVVQVEFDTELVTPTLGDEDFLRAVSEWEQSEHAEAVRRTLDFERELDEASEALESADPASD